MGYLGEHGRLRRITSLTDIGAEFDPYEASSASLMHKVKSLGDIRQAEPAARVAEANR
ncbi:hypothetical protein BRAS3809_6630002 [Bradyrhizobium sp. STM 3809]|nr:hypothetical protein BRAS3809_6630002 [Bradyrhizobium sp. STM 3809]